MTDRIRTLNVLLDRDMRTDDVQVVKQAIHLIRYVESVSDGSVIDGEELMRRQAALREFMGLHDRFLYLFRGFGEDSEDKLKRIKEILGKGG